MHADSPHTDDFCFSFSCNSEDLNQKHSLSQPWWFQEIWIKLNKQLRDILRFLRALPFEKMVQTFLLWYSIKCLMD